METKDIVIECVKIIRAAHGHSAVYTTHDKGTADSVKEDVIKAICQRFEVNYERTKTL